MDEGPLASRFRRRMVMVMLVLYTGFVLFVTLSPATPGEGFLRRAVVRVLGSLHRRGLPEWVDYSVVEFFGNVLMFVPLGVFAALLIARRWWWVLLVTGTVFSGAIELAQFLFLPGRVSDPRDLISNTAGFLLGAAAAVFFRLLVAHRDSLVERDRRAMAQASAGRHS